MTIGQLIKSYRLKQNLSQPELSEKANIEQSYLSKLENDKSIPSNEIFASLLAALDIEVNKFVSLQDYQQNRQQFDQLDSVKQHFEQQQRNNQVAQRSFLYACMLAFSLGVAIFYSGWQASIFQEAVYIYNSSGIVKDGEPIDLFNKPVSDMVDNSEPGASTKYRKLTFQLNQRRLEKYETQPEFIGQSYIEESTEGRRYFTYDSERAIPRTINGVLQFIGILLIVLGLAGFVVERRMY